jgi:hypothetical protein
MMPMCAPLLEHILLKHRYQVTTAETTRAICPPRRSRRYHVQWIALDRDGLGLASEVGIASCCERDRGLRPGCANGAPRGNYFGWIGVGVGWLALGDVWS